jgi:hypothetical protein
VKSVALIVCSLAVLMISPWAAGQVWYGPGGGYGNSDNYCPDRNRNGICDDAESAQRRNHRERSPDYRCRDRNRDGICDDARSERRRRDGSSGNRGHGTGGGPLEARWSSAGRLGGAFRYCIHIGEPAEPRSHTWSDNYLCFNRPDHGFRYSYSGPIPGMRCKSFNLKGGVWADNYICSRWKDFAWFPRALRSGYRCIRVTEPADPDPRANGSRGYSNHFCLKSD